MATHTMTDIEKQLLKGFIMDYSKGAIWKGIKTFKNEQLVDVSNEQFVDIIKEQYGIKLTLIESMIKDGYDSNYEIVDEQKYLLFTLKYVN